jgi:hypothetical protein
MNRNLVDQIADAILYEAYMLYPYRPSVKNRQRWTFGGLYPRAYCEAQPGADAPSNQTECLVHGGLETWFGAAVRFLHLTERTVGECTPPLHNWPANGPEAPYRRVESLQIGTAAYYSWQEAEPREVHVSDVQLGVLVGQPLRQEVHLPGRRWLEPLRSTGADVIGVLVREQQPIDAAIELQAVAVDHELYKIMLKVMNETKLEDVASRGRDDAVLRSLVSTHSILGVDRGEFVSLLDPPERYRAVAAACHNVGTWPVLVGAEEEKDAMLSSPIILYDYPRVAPESPGQLFDSTEIDEILTLRIQTLTDEEKRTAAALDERVRNLLTRTEALAREELLGLHGTLRGPS